MKKRFRYIYIALLVVSMVFAENSLLGAWGFLDSYGATPVTTPVPQIEAQAGVLIDAKTGAVLYNKNMDVPMEPASTTKMITGLLAIEKLPMDKVVTIDKETSFTEGSRIYLLEGEKITVENLLYALFLESANDAAVALAKEMGGSVSDFATMMNQRAAETGAVNTSFKNPNGLHLDGHLTTAYDLAMIAKTAMTNPKFRHFVKTYKHVIPATNMQEERNMYNTNRLLYDNKTQVTANGVLRTCKYSGVTGIKTGYTSHAGGCLVAGAKRGDTELISVVLKSSDKGRFGDSIALLDWGFENYATVQTARKGDEMGTMKVKKGSQGEVKLVAASDGFATLPKSMKAADLTKVTKMEETLEAPFEKGQKAGALDFFYGENVVSSVQIVTAEAVDEGGCLAAVKRLGAKGLLAVAAGIFAGLVALGACGILTARHVNMKKRARRRAERAMQIAMERELERLERNKERYKNKW